jgi:murein DD-endopeptidase MepM/ murein hydrolase activator NlpD
MGEVAPTPEPMPEPVPEEPEIAVQGAAVVVLPEPEAEVAPEPPALVVDPLRGETVAAFSMDALQYSDTMGDWRTHDGVDIAADAGTPVCAASSGTVLDVRDDDLMGTTVVISHDGGYDTLYANLQSTPTVAVGDYVTAGQVVGAVGRTAIAESAEPTHLHFAVTKDGEFIDPEAYLKK